MYLCIGELNASTLVSPTTVVDVALRSKAGIRRHGGPKPQTKTPERSTAKQNRFSRSARWDSFIREKNRKFTGNGRPSHNNSTQHTAQPHPHDDSAIQRWMSRRPFFGGSVPRCVLLAVRADAIVFRGAL